MNTITKDTVGAGITTKPLLPTFSLDEPVTYRIEDVIQYIKKSGIKARHLRDWRSRGGNDGKYYPIAMLVRADGSAVIVSYNNTHDNDPYITVFDTAKLTKCVFYIPTMRYLSVLRKVAEAFGKSLVEIRQPSSSSF